MSSSKHALEYLLNKNESSSKHALEYLLNKNDSASSDGSLSYAPLPQDFQVAIGRGSSAAGMPPSVPGHSIADSMQNQFSESSSPSTTAGAGEDFRQSLREFKQHGDTSGNPLPGSSGSTVRHLVCATCSKVFVRKGDLKKHTKAVHEGFKPHSCKVCGALFSEKGNLHKHHISKHTHQRPFKCNAPECTKAFPFRDGLKRHMKTHGGGVNPNS